MSELEYCAFCDGGYAHSGICDKCTTEIGQTGKELADKDRQLAEALAEIESKNKLIEQMREALSNADDLIDEYAADYEHRDNVDEIRDEIKAALEAAERINK